MPPMKPDFRWDNLPSPTWIGVVNVTPDSFSDGGKYLARDAAVAHVLKLAHNGAAIVDLGAEASSFFRPGVEPIHGLEQLERLHPILTRLSLLPPPKPFISIDTRDSGLARKTLDRGAVIINDISAGTHDPGLVFAVSHAKAAVILMHMGPTFPDNPPQDDPNLLGTIRTYLAERLAAAERSGIPHEKIALDPGIGFGKTMADNWRLVVRGHELADLGCALVLGFSRKRFLATPPPEAAEEYAAAVTHVEQFRPLAAHDRDLSTAAATLLALRRGIRLHRVHNVALCRAAVAN